MVSIYVPDAGDVVWMNFDPQAGHEQAGHRPGLVVTPASYNARSKTLIVCPMTSRIRNHSFEVIVSKDPPSAILVDHVKSLDWRARRAVFQGRVPTAVLFDVRAKLEALLDL